MTDKEWERVLPQLPKEKARGRPRKHDLRRIVDAIFYLLQSGCQWDMLPKDFPPWQTVYRYFRDWRRDGTWARLHDALYRDIRDLEGREDSPGLAIVDSQSVKTGPDAREMVGFDASKKVKGRKRHIVVDTLGMMLKATVHGADIQDRNSLALACERLVQRFPFIEKICTDGSYSLQVAGHSGSFTITAEYTATGNKNYKTSDPKTVTTTRAAIENQDIALNYGYTTAVTVSEPSIGIRGG